MNTAPGTIDAIDRMIIEVLTRHGRATLAEIGNEVNLSPPAVKRRIDRLESASVIRGYTAILDHSLLGLVLEAFVELQFVGTASVAAIESFVDDVPEIQAIFTIAGDPDALAWVRATDVRELTHIIDEIRQTGMVTGTKTLMVLGSRVQSEPSTRLGRTKTGNGGSPMPRDLTL